MNLTERQMQVVVLVGRDGVTWDRAAREIGICVQTVRAHAKRVQIKGGLTEKRPRAAMSQIYWCRIHKEELY